MNYCKDCKWFLPGGLTSDSYSVIECSLCKHPKATTTTENPVIGAYTIYNTCSKMRGLGVRHGECGNGELFEPRESE